MHTVNNVEKKMGNLLNRTEFRIYIIARRPETMKMHD